MIFMTDSPGHPPPADLLHGSIMDRSGRSIESEVYHGFY